MTSAGLLILASGFLLMAIASVPELNRRIRGMFYGWFIAGLGALIMALGGVLNNGLPIWSPVLRNAFGWTAGHMSWAYAMTQVEGGFLGPAAGLLIDKLGPRRMVLISLIIQGCGFLLFSQVHELWQFYVAFLVMSLGSSLGSWLPMLTVVNHWFIRRRAMAMSVAMEGHALGAIIAPLMLAWAIGGADPNISERFGWRASALFIGILCFALAVPLSRLIRNRPEDLGLKPDGDSAVPAAASPVDAGVNPSKIEEGGYTWREAIRTKAFWLISFGHATSTIVIATVSVHLGLMLDDRGFSLQAISGVVAIYTAASAIFMLVGGYVGDRLPIRLVAFGFTILQPLALVVLVLSHDTAILFLFAVLLGIGNGARMPVTTAMRGVYFGNKAFAAIMSMSMVPQKLLLFGAPLFAGLMRDATGNYDVSFLTIAVVSFSGSFLFLLLGEPPMAYRSHPAPY